MMRLLVTRPMPDAVRQAERLKALGHEVFPAPMLEVQFLDTALPSLTVMQALIATSNINHVDIRISVLRRTHGDLSAIRRPRWVSPIQVENVDPGAVVVHSDDAAKMCSIDIPNTRIEDDSPPIWRP